MSGIAASADAVTDVRARFRHADGVGGMPVPESLVHTAPAIRFGSARAPERPSACRSARKPSWPSP